MIRLRCSGLFAMVALVPLALNPSLKAAGGSIMVPLCSGDGVARTVEMPLGQGRLPGDDSSHCCDKACHSAGSRKKIRAVS